MARSGKINKSENGESYLDGRLLLAMPAMSDPRFSGSVVYICAHSSDGAMGIIINRRAPHISFPELLSQLEIIPEEKRIDVSHKFNLMPILMGGPVETGRGFILHSSDYFITESTLPINADVCLTATLDILHAIASGEGPSKALFALGYAGWAASQLEEEIQANGWLHCDADPELVFDATVEQKYNRALAKIGIDPSHLVNDAGHA